MIQIGKYSIRPYAPGDVAALVKYGNNHKVWQHLRDRFPHPYTRAHAIDWVRHVQRQRPTRDFAVAGEIELIGGVGIHVQDDVHRRSAEIGYWLGEPFWGRGIATEVVDAMTDYAFANFPIVRIYANVFDGNPASARVLEKVGYQYEGRMRKSVYKDGALLDQLMYGIVRE